MRKYTLLVIFPGRQTPQYPTGENQTNTVQEAQTLLAQWLNEQGLLNAETERTGIYGMLMDNRSWNGSVFTSPATHTLNIGPHQQILVS